MATRRLQAAPITPKAPCLVEVDRYKQLMIKQRDIMMALTHRLNERDETILALQAEVSSSGTPPSARECPPPPRLHRSEHHFFGVAKPSFRGLRPPIFTSDGPRQIRHFRFLDSSVAASPSNHPH